MAGDWIKMGTGLTTHPKVVRIASALKADRLRVIGGLHAVWCLFDAHSEDGKLAGYDPAVVDELIGWPGFSDAMLKVQWMEVDGESLALPEFDTHNGASAKRRAMEADRKRNVRKVSARDADKKRTRGEKNRVEIKAKDIVQPAAPPAPEPAQPVKPMPKGAKGTAEEFNRVWACYPVKKGRADAERHWRTHRLDPMADEIIAHIRKMEAEDEQWRNGFIPHGSTYFCGKRWEDEPTGPTSDAKPNAKPPPPESFGPAAAMKPSETPLERDLAYARQRFDRGEFESEADYRATVKRIQADYGPKP